jgi:hypothetical protein
MNKSFFSLLILVLLSIGCSKSLPEPVGMKSVEEAVSASEAFVLKGDVSKFRSHCDFSSLPEKANQQVNAMLASWKGVQGWRHMKTEVIGFEEAKAEDRQQFKDYPWLADATKWNITPEKVIVHRFVSDAQGQENSKLRLGTGIFQKNGLWYFSAQHTAD